MPTSGRTAGAKAEADQRSQNSDDPAKQLQQVGTGPHVGVIRTLNPGSTYIACETTHRAFGKDVQLLPQHKAGQGFKVGSYLSFTVGLSAKGLPQTASATLITEEQAMEASRGMPLVMATPAASGPSAGRPGAEERAKEEQRRKRAFEHAEAARLEESTSSQDNPFRLPPDDEIFLMREQERLRRMEERERVKNIRAMDKSTSTSRLRKINRIRDEEFQGMAHSASAPDLKGRQKAGKGDAGIGQGMGIREGRRDRDNIEDFVAKKREMFLVQMSLDVKKAEILKLDEKARMKEEALRKSQSMLDEDVTRFDTFLQANDAKAHKAMKQAEDMTKRKQERQQRIKQLRAQISTIQSEISKHKEQREECVKYKRFLDKLTPQEWTDRQVEAKKERRRQRRINYVQTRLNDIGRKVQQELDAEEAARREAEPKEVKKARSKKKEDEEMLAFEEEQREKARRRIRRKYPTEQQVQKEYLSEDSGEELPLYFEQPLQLLSIFQALEEQNLFLIQNSQETEQALEEVTHSFEHTKRVMGDRAATLKEQIRTFEKLIDTENRQSAELRKRAQKASGEDRQDTMLKELASQVLEIHQLCGYEADRDPDTLQMLAQIEAKLEELLTTLDEAEQDPRYTELIYRLEKEKERERRDRLKKQRMELQARKNEERLKASLLRSQAPVHRKVGKQIMFRSAPLHQERKVVIVDDEAEARARDTKVFGFYIEKNGIPNVGG